MKINKILFGILALVMSIFLVGCNDDNDYAISNTPLLTDGSVVTGSSDVTANSATFHGSVTGLEKQVSSSYVTGFYYGYSENDLSESIVTSSESEFSGSLTGLPKNQTIYYQAYVTLQGKVTYKGEVKSLVTTDATVSTGDVTAVTFSSVNIAGKVEKYPADAKVGFVFATSDNIEEVRAGLRVEASSLEEAFSVVKSGLLPSTTYYYAAYLDLGSGIVYGDIKSFTTAAHEFDPDNDFVDLGLSVKWAKCNVGAEKETDLGGLFGFGDVTGVNTSIDPTKYASSDTYKTTSDIAYFATGGKGTLPTAELFEELFTLCKTEWTEQDGVAGYKVTGPNGNSIFLPAAGHRVQSEITEEGYHGYYLTGTVNKSNPEFAIDYEFNSATGNRATRAVYEALSVRPVSTARNIPFDKKKLFTTWYMDNGVDGKQHVFEGPFTQFGKTDTWGTITNNEPNPYQSIHWEMGKGNGWIGYDYGTDYGYMKFFEKDGKDYVTVHRADGSENTGEITIDEKNKTVDMGNINILCGTTWVPQTSGVRNVLSLTDDGLQIGILSGDDFQYSVNYYSQEKADKDAKVQVKINACGSDWGGVWDKVVDNIDPESLDGQHTLTYNGSCPDGMVNTIDFVGLVNRYPNAFVRIDDIKLDGQSIKFNANNFCYGNMENNGNYRVELFNIYGKGAADNKVKESAFSNGKNLGSEPALKFTSSLEVTYTIFTNGPVGTYKPSLIAVNGGWGGTGFDGYDEGVTFELSLNPETAKYEISRSDFDIKYNGEGFSTGSMLAYIQIPELYRFFPTMHSTLDALLLDNKSVTYDVTKVLDSNEDPKYRLELWNCWGKTKENGCAFGTPNGDIMPGLAFSKSIETKFTIRSLYVVPQW